MAIHGIGGLGHLALQYANRLGYRTVALSRGPEKETLARELGAHVYIDTDASDAAAALQKLGGARVILCTAPNAKAIAGLIDGLGMDGQLIIVAGLSEPLSFYPGQLFRGGRSDQGLARPAAGRRCGVQHAFQRHADDRDLPTGEGGGGLREDDVGDGALPVGPDHGLREFAERVEDVMTEMMELIRSRRSLRAPYDPGRPVEPEKLAQILEAARWSPTAHNMQNFEIVVVDDPQVLDAIARIERPVSETFVRENYAQLSFSEEELLAAQDRDPRQHVPAVLAEARLQARRARARTRSPPCARPLPASPLLLVVVYDPSRRAPASEGDFLGIVSLGCVMENMWLAAESAGHRHAHRQLAELRAAR